MARAVLEVTGAQAYNVLQNNGRPAHQFVMHVHFHIIPRMDERGLEIGWNIGSLDADEGAALAERLRAALGQRD